ncbi:MAG: hypothetical protein ACE5JR_12850 [Gemmatimonadota bacterium]
MSLVRLVHWNAAEAEERADRLRVAGYQVNHEPLSAAALRELRDNPPAAMVIDLARLPMQGRDVGIAIRHYKSTRHVPLVFVDGDPTRVARIREQLPDAVYTDWSRIRGSLSQAIAHPPTDPVATSSLLAGYSGTPLPRKLGIKANSVVSLVNAPEDFENTLGELPDGVTLRRQAGGRRDLTIWFTQSRKELERRIDRMASLAHKGGLWIVWPKKASGLATDLTQAAVREIGLATGLVDFKVCAVDETWTGLRFSRRKAKRPESTSTAE